MQQSPSDPPHPVEEPQGAVGSPVQPSNGDGSVPAVGDDLWGHRLHTSHFNEIVRTLLECLVATGLFTDTAAALLAIAVLGCPRENLLKTPESLVTYLMLSTVGLLAVIWLFQHFRRGDGRYRLSPRPDGGYGREFVAGALLSPLFLLGMTGLHLLIRLVLPSLVPPSNPLLDLIKTPLHLALFVLSGVLAGGLREEVQRAFLLNRSRVLLGSPFYALVGWSVIFGLMHLEQGLDAVIIAGLLGAGFGLIYIWRRNLVAPVLCHALYNSGVLWLFWSGVGRGH